jgi:hypothetical protein
MPNQPSRTMLPQAVDVGPVERMSSGSLDGVVY